MGVVNDGVNDADVNASSDVLNDICAQGRSSAEGGGGECGAGEGRRGD